MLSAHPVEAFSSLDFPPFQIPPTNRVARSRRQGPQVSPLFFCSQRREELQSTARSSHPRVDRTFHEREIGAHVRSRSLREVYTKCEATVWLHVGFSWKA